jgi:hypothetical protein
VISDQPAGGPVFILVWLAPISVQLHLTVPRAHWLAKSSLLTMSVVVIMMRGTRKENIPQLSNHWELQELQFLRLDLHSLFLLIAVLAARCLMFPSIITPQASALVPSAIFPSSRAVQPPNFFPVLPRNPSSSIQDREESSMELNLWLS